MKSSYSIIVPTVLLIISGAPIINLLVSERLPLVFPDYYYLIISNMAFLISAISRALTSKEIKISSSFFLHYKYSMAFISSNILFLVLIFSGEMHVREGNSSDMWGLGFMNILSILNLYYIDFIVQHIPDSHDEEEVKEHSAHVAAALEFIKPFAFSVALTVICYHIFGYENTVPNQLTVFGVAFAVFSAIKNNYKKVFS